MLHIDEKNKVITGYSYEKPDNYAKGFKFQELDTGLTYYNDSVGWVAFKEKNTLPIKKPNKQLNFKDGGIPANASTCFHVSLFSNTKYYIDSKIKTFTDITGAVVEGVAWSSAWGDPVKIVDFYDGSFVVFTNVTTGTTFAKSCAIYRFSDINDATPSQVYLSSHDSNWAGAFGISSYTNGVNTTILAGEYGNTLNSKDLLLSLDDGQTYTVIKSTGDSTNVNNIHFHDVEIDPYSGILWVGQGDGVGDKKISWSQTMGSSWTNLDPNLDSGVGLQPTLIMSFSERVLFGNDSGFAGLCAIDQPKEVYQWDNLLNSDPSLPYMFHMTRNRTIGGEPCYPQYPHKFGDLEGVFCESGHGQQFPAKIFMTGDGGNSFHVVGITSFGGNNGLSISTVILGMDENFIYTRRGNDGKILYAEKPNFN